MEKFFALSLSEVVFILLINVKMPTVVGILTFTSEINFVLSRVVHEKSFITWGQASQMTQTGKELSGLPNTMQCLF